ncbi:MAG: hypothetical protein KDA61_06095, partial [Planctomycetales bacterium]|nr:hypothetical protein [Planctomycetales bacterium]
MRFALVLLFVLSATNWLRGQEATSQDQTAGTPIAESQAYPRDPQQSLERTCFQTSRPWNPQGNLRSDVALVYGIGPSLPDRLRSCKNRGYDVHVMTGVAWGEYQDYLYGRFDGVNHVDNAQTDREGNRISHGGDVYYMCPAENFGQFLSVGVREALEAGASSVHLEEPEFWARGGYGEGFKREWLAYYQEPWQPPHSSVDARWKCAKLKYYLYRRALQQVFESVEKWNQEHGAEVKCYVPTHSLLNYAHWCIVSPQSSLAQIDGCHGYVAQVWTGTSRTPNYYRGARKERTFETAFLEYGVMQNLVRSTGRRVWYLNDPVEDNPRHDWNDYRTNWESTLTASLLQPEVWRFEVAPWPERIFGGRYPSSARREDRRPIPPEYATELQVVMHVLEDMRQDRVEWDAGTQRLGVLVSDSLMFQRAEPTPSDPNMAHVYGQLMPLVKRGMPVEPVQLENVTLDGFLKPFDVLALSYQGQKPLAPDVHAALAAWVRNGGELIFVDDDSDPYNRVREWWNQDAATAHNTPRSHLFDALGLSDDAFGENPTRIEVGDGGVVWLRRNPVKIGLQEAAEQEWIEVWRDCVAKAEGQWRETNYIQLRRGPYVAAAGLDESPASGAHALSGRFIDLFDPDLPLVEHVELTPGARRLLLDLDAPEAAGKTVLASACKMLPVPDAPAQWYVEGVGGTQAIVLLRVPAAPGKVTLDGTLLEPAAYEFANGLLRIRFANESHPRILSVDAEE